MTASPPAEGVLLGREGELIFLSIATEPKLLEDLLEVLAGLDFPVNPQLYHGQTEVTVEFPAYSGQVERVRDALRDFASGVQVTHPLVGGRSA
jgi:hypothetical protein